MCLVKLVESTSPAPILGSKIEIERPTHRISMYQRIGQNRRDVVRTDVGQLLCLRSSLVDERDVSFKIICSTGELRYENGIMFLPQVVLSTFP